MVADVTESGGAPNGSGVTCLHIDFVDCKRFGGALDLYHMRSSVPEESVDFGVYPNR